jgi:hypothetical protein
MLPRRIFHFALSQIDNTCKPGPCPELKLSATRLKGFRGLDFQEINLHRNSTFPNDSRFLSKLSMRTFGKRFIHQDD